MSYHAVHESPYDDTCMVCVGYDLDLTDTATHAVKVWVPLTAAVLAGLAAVLLVIGLRRMR